MIVCNRISPPKYLAVSRARGRPKPRGTLPGCAASASPLVQSSSSAPAATPLGTLFRSSPHSQTRSTQAMPPPWSEMVTKTPNWPRFTFTRMGAGSQPRPAAVRAVATTALLRISRRIQRTWPGMWRMEAPTPSSKSIGTRSPPLPGAESERDKFRMRPTGLVGCRTPMATPAGLRVPGGTGPRLRKCAPSSRVPMRDTKKRPTKVSKIGASAGSWWTSCWWQCPSKCVTFVCSSNVLASASQYSTALRCESSLPKSSCML
mmetsp:Transcript_5557/g.11323  ORF Transcript_5557/g.11323 Transcript_5557/m.11323 type:complete len:261 (+) Transcript_5557:150-932(+)